MQKIKYSIGTLVVSAFLLAGCDKDENIKLRDVEIVNNNALLKIAYFSPTQRNPNVQIKINGMRVSNLVIYATPFPGGGYNTQGSSNSDYLSIVPGSTKVTISLPKAGTNEDSLEILNTTVNLQGSKQYTLFTSDSIPALSSFLQEDIVVVPDSGYAKVRFVNLMPNLPAVDFYRNNVLIKANVALNTVTDFDTASIALNPSQFHIRPAGALPSTTAIAVYPAGVTFTLTNKRSYTILARGYAGSALSVIKPNISLIVNN